MNNRRIKILKLSKYAEGRLTIGKVYECLDNSPYTIIMDDLGRGYHVCLSNYPDSYEVLEDEA